MKKITALILALALCLAFTACGKESSQEPEISDPGVTAVSDAEEPAIAGGWNTYADVTSNGITGKAAEAFEKAAANYEKELKPAALLGTQVVAGINYMMLCRDAEDKWQIAVVYFSLSGDAEITKVNPFIFTDFVNKDIPATPEQLAGGWAVNTEFDGNTLDESAAAAFSGAVGNAEYTPVAVLGTQVVAGLNYAFLCLGKSEDEDPAYFLNVLTVYSPISGQPEITGNAFVDLKDFNK